MHPFLQDSLPIRWSILTADAVEPDIKQALAEARKAVDSVAARSAPFTYENTVAALDEGLETLNRAWGLVNHLDSVCNSPELRKAFNAMLPEVSEFFSGIPLNDALWSSLRAFGESDAVGKLSPTKQRYVRETLAGLSRSRMPTCRIREESNAPGNPKRGWPASRRQYSENCLDATNDLEEDSVTTSRAGPVLPDFARSAARQSSRQKGHEDAWRFPLQARLTRLGPTAAEALVRPAI